MRLPVRVARPFPAGVPHRNWNGGREPTVHLAFNTALPDPTSPFARSV